jgi:hypothetical protein
MYSMVHHGEDTVVRIQCTKEQINRAQPLAAFDGRSDVGVRTLHCTALHCTALHCTALHCTALH